MNIPNKVKVGNITYKIEQKDLKNKYLGRHRVNAEVGALISVDKNLTDEIKENTFYHELTHAILYQLGLEDSEHLVQSLSNILQNLFIIKEEND